MAKKKTASRVARAAEPRPTPRKPLEWHDHLPQDAHWNAVEAALRATVAAARKDRAAARVREDIEKRLKRLQELRAWFHRVRIGTMTGVEGPDRAALGRGGSTMHRTRKALGGVNKGVEAIRR